MSRNLPAQVRPEVVKSFLSKCARIRTFTDPEGTKEHSLSINLTGIVAFYVDQIGSDPFVTTWEEIRQCLMVALDQAKRSKPEGYELIVRISGGCQIWLAIKIYTALVMSTDRIYYAGDILIRL